FTGEEAHTRTEIATRRQHGWHDAGWGRRSPPHVLLGFVHARSHAKIPPVQCSGPGSRTRPLVTLVRVTCTSRPTRRGPPAGIAERLASLDLVVQRRHQAHSPECRG